MELIKRVLIAVVLVTVVAPVINIQAAAESHEGSQVGQVSSREEEIKEAAAQSNIARIVWQELSPEEQEEMGNALVGAACSGKIDEVRSFLEKGVPIDFVCYSGLTALDVALRYGGKAMVDVLCELSAHSYVINRSKHEMIMISRFIQAIKSNNVGVVKALLKSDMPVNILDDENRTPLIMAVCCDSHEVFTLLLNNKKIIERIDYQDKNGNTALGLAIKANDYNRQYLLVSAGADVGPIVKGNCDFIKKSVTSNNNELLERLLSAGIPADWHHNWDGDIDFDEDASTALNTAVKQGRAYMAYRLVLAGACIEKCNEGGYKTWHEKADVATKLAIQKAILEIDQIIEMVTGDQSNARKYSLDLPTDLRWIIGDYLEDRQEGDLIELIRKYDA